MSQTTTILVTGSSGRLGRLLRAASRRDGPDGVRFVFQSRSASADLQWDTTDPLDLLPPCDMVVALWGRVEGDAQALSENTDLARLSQDVARHCGAMRVLHMSSAAVYGVGENLSETAPLKPSKNYGHAKLAMENAVATGGEAGAPENIILRLANVVGADSLAPALVADAPVRLDQFADGCGPRRSYLSAGDFLTYIIKLANCATGSLPKVMNVASVERVGMDALSRAAGKEIIWKPAASHALQNVTLDISKLNSVFPDVTPRKTAHDLVKDWQELEALA